MIKASHPSKIVSDSSDRTKTRKLGLLVDFPKQSFRNINDDNS